MTREERRAQKIEMVHQFHESGMTQKAFAEYFGVPRSKLDYWVRVVRKETAATNRPTMVSVGSVAIPSKSSALRVTTPSGVIVEVDLPASEEMIRTVLRAAEAV